MKRRIGIAGESECGKSTVAKALSRQFWLKEKIPSLVYDPNGYAWGPHAWVTNSEEKFREAVKKKTGCLVVIEDASATINRDRDFSPFFTVIRHQQHHLMVLCHDATDLLRPMRQNLNELYLFNQSEESVKIWRQSQTSMLGIELSKGLASYAFIHAVKFSTITPTPQRLKL